MPYTPEFFLQGRQTMVEVALLAAAVATDLESAESLRASQKKAAAVPTWRKMRTPPPRSRFAFAIRTIP